jgi:tetratricopeptide (TPR) repeat protein
MHPVSSWAGSVAVFFLLGAAAAQAAVSPSDMDVAPASYREALERAQTGDVQGAIAAASRWSSDQVSQGAQALLVDPSCRRPCLESAILIHTEAAVATRYRVPRDASQAHRHAAESLLSWLVRVSEPPARDDARDFERAWLLALGYSYQDTGDSWHARATFEKARARFPHDPEALVAVGALLEAIAAAPGFFPIEPVDDGARARAAECYEQALAAQPDHVEARLRLGQVEARLGRFERARKDLQAVVASGLPSIAAAFAHLFLGDISAQEGRADDAIAEYGAALRMEPTLQPAAIALAASLQSTGRRQEGASSLLDALRSARGDVISWHSYHAGLFHGYRAAVEALWRRTR